VWDDFNNGTFAPTWLTGPTAGSVVYLGEAAGKAQFGGTQNLTFGMSMAYAWSDGWLVDMTTDWAVQADWHCLPPAPDAIIGVNWSEVGIAFGLMMEGIPEQSYMHRGLTISAHRALLYDDVNGWQHFNGEGINFWMNGTFGSPVSWFERIWTTNTVYIWYDASAGVIFYDDLPPGVGAWPAYAAGVDQWSAATSALIAFGGYSFGAVPAFSSTSLTADNGCMLYGRLVGPRAGACVVDGQCFDTVVESCAGEFTLGAGCCDCQWDADCSTELSASDLEVLINAWGVCPGCREDVDGSGVVDVRDVLLVLEHWDDC